MKTQNMKRKRLLRKNHTEKEENLDQVVEELKQEVSAKMQRFSGCRKRQYPFYQHKIFRTDCKKFYNLLRQKNTKEKTAPTKEEIENFWKEIFRKKIKHNEEGYWMKNQCQQNASMEWSPVSEMEVTQVLRMM